MRRVLRGVAVPAVLFAVLGVAPYGGGRPQEPPPERNEIPFAERWSADLHGGLARIGNSAVTCDEKRDQYRIEDAAPCVEARNAEGRSGYNNNYQMTLRPRTSANLVLPAGSQVVHAQLYWGGTHGMDSPNGPKMLTDEQISRVTLTSPDGTPVPVTADSPIGRFRGEVDYAYQTTADVTDIVAAAGPGTYTLSDFGAVATPYSYGGWTLVVAYENAAEPMRRVTLYDGYRAVESDAKPVRIVVNAVKEPKHDWPQGTLGYVAYDGDRTLTGDQVSVRAPHSVLFPLADKANPVQDAMNSTADGFPRTPADRDTFGWDADEFDVTGAMWPGDSQLGIDFSTTDDGDGYQVGAVYTQVDLDDRSAAAPAQPAAAPPYDPPAQGGA